MIDYTELPDGVHRGHSMRLVQQIPPLFVVVSLYIIGYGRVRFCVHPDEHESNGWVRCEYSQDILLTLGPCIERITNRGKRFKTRDVTLRRLDQKLSKENQ
jgi:hypothetical protein